MFVTFVLVLAALGLSYGAGVKKKVVTPKDFPTGRPFSAGIQVGDTLYVSGSTGSDLKTGKVPEKFEDEVQLCFDNIGGILKAGRYDFADAVSVQVFSDNSGTYVQITDKFGKFRRTDIKEPA